MGSQPLRAIQVRRISGRKILRFFLLPLKKRRKKKKMMQSLMLVLLAVAGSQAAKLTATGVDLEPIFLFLDDDGENGVDATELKALTTTGDSDGDGLVTAAEFESAWSEIAVGFGVPASKHSKYFRLVDANGDGTLTDAESMTLFGKIDADNSGGISLQEFFDAISSVL